MALIFRDKSLIKDLLQRKASDILINKHNDLYLSENEPHLNNILDGTDSNYTRNKKYEEIKPRVYDHLSPLSVKASVSISVWFN